MLNITARVKRVGKETRNSLVNGGSAHTLYWLIIASMPIVSIIIGLLLSIAYR